MSGIKPPKLGNSGLLLVEILLAVAIMSLMSLVILSSLIYGRESTAIAGDRTRAVEIANAAVAAVQNIAHDSYSNLSAYSDGTDYYLDISASQWQISTSVTSINTIYTPKIVFSGGPNGSRQAVISVSWQQTSDRIGTISITTYFTDWQADTAYVPMMVAAHG
ncbi:MAG TPA: hypothetical protein VJC09_02470 [Candidatus Saccharimonadales bacterium]|nr:hypothetical protein [Candidatus Saccharimonadales bacterium]